MMIDLTSFFPSFILFLNGRVFKGDRGRHTSDYWQQCFSHRVNDGEIGKRETRVCEIRREYCAAAWPFTLSAPQVQTALFILVCYARL